MSKVIKKYFVIGMVMMMAMTTACSEQDKETEEKDSTQQTESGTSHIEQMSYMTTEGFYPAGEVVEDYEFKKTMWSDDPLDSGFSMVSYEGQYPLSDDEDDIIEVYFDTDKNEGYIQINNIQSELYYASDVENVTIIDIDERDQYKEVAVYDAGPSGDPTIIIYRLVEDTIHEIGSFYGGRSYDSVLFDKKGKVIEAIGYVDFLETQIVTQYQEVADNTTNTINVDSSAAMNKSYKLSKELMIAFGETANPNLEDAYEYINMENIMTLKEGDEIILLGADPYMGVYCVRLPDGRRGVFTDQLAG